MRAQANGAGAGRGGNPPNGGNLPNGNPGAGNPGNGQNEEDQGGYNENPKRLGGYNVHTLHTSKREKKLVQHSTKGHPENMKGSNEDVKYYKVVKET